MNDNPALQASSGHLLAMITSVTPSLRLVEPLLNQLITVLETAEVSSFVIGRWGADEQSWKTKVHCMPVLSLVYYRNMSLLSETCKARSLDVVAKCLRDNNQEVREIASR
jgi:proteasome activator subunit 4